MPSGKMRWHLRTRPEQQRVVFCSARCQNTHVAKVGAAQQEEIIRGER